MLRAGFVALLVSLPATAAQHIAVLELKNRLPARVRDQFPAGYFTDQIREGALRAVDPAVLQIISRENLLVLIRSSGKTLEECEGECEVDTGKRIGADFVISGELVLVGSTAKASLKLHNTQAGNLLSAVTATGKTAEDLDRSLAGSIPTLLKPLEKLREEARAATAPPATGAPPVTRPKPPPFFVEKTSGPSTLAELPTLPRVLQLLKDNYFDPSRLDAQRMADGAVAALAAVSGGAIEVDATSVRAGGKSTPRPRAATQAALGPALQEVGGFLNSALRADHALLQGAAGEYVAVQGLLQALDARSSLWPPSTNAEMKVQTKANFGGLGIVTGQDAGRLKIRRVLPGTPAAGAALRLDDVIAAVDGKPTDGLELSDAVALMRGKPGSTVQLILERDGQRLPVSLERASITLDPVRSAMLPGGIGYLRLESFSATAAAKLKGAFAALEQPKGLVFDLRGNGGGLFNAAIDICDFFLPSGSIVTTVGMAGKTHEETSAKPGDAGEAVPLVILTDDATGAAAEVTAGALRFNGRAILVGRKTAGRGTLQSLYEQPDGAALKITTAQYLVAGTHPVEGAGLAPDVVRESKFDEDPAKDASVSFARQVLLDAKGAGREALLSAARAH